jgi:peptide-methionine (S)-S-oxide reductase
VGCNHRTHPYRMKFSLISCLALLAIGTSLAADDAKPAAAKTEPTKPTAPKSMETVTLAGGCFWCIEAALERIQGISDVQSGYTNGKTKNPSYEEVCTGLTGHTEAVKITFDPAVITFEKVVEVFFALIDPTQVNAQGPDRGTQYRSGIYFANDAQKAAAEKLKTALATSGKYTKPIATEVVEAGTWYPAEEYHQNYFEKHYEAGTGNWGYLCNVSAPKVEKLKTLGVALKPRPEKK